MKARLLSSAKYAGGQMLSALGAFVTLGAFGTAVGLGIGFGLTLFAQLLLLP